MIFVDTGAWFALSVESDSDYFAATKFVAQNRERLITTDYIVDELLTLFIVRDQREKGIEWISDVLWAGLTELTTVDAGIFAEACQVYRKFADKEWSFTDCTSYVVMQRLAITKALSFDSHFRQFGTVQVLPS